MPTLRIGALPVKQRAQWNEAWAAKFQDCEASVPEVKLEPDTVVLKKSPRPTLKRKSRRKAAVRPPTSVPTSYTMVLAGPSLSEVGEYLESKPIAVYGSCTVTEVTSNFVHTDGLPRQGKAAADAVPLHIGMVVEVRLSPLDDDGTRLLVLAIGVIWKTSRTRAIVFRRQPDTDDWGELETMNASAFPTQEFCTVPRTHTQTHTHAYTHTHTHTHTSSSIPETPTNCYM